MSEKILYNATVVYLLRAGKILLAEKTKKIGAGYLNGHGGGIEEGETPLDCAIREFSEETKDQATGLGGEVRADQLEKRAVVDFHNTTTEGKEFTCRVHFFVASDWQGEVQATQEMANPSWYDVDSLPFDRMMPADRVWLPLMLQGKKIYAEARYGPYQKELLGEVIVTEMESLPE